MKLNVLFASMAVGFIVAGSARGESAPGPSPASETSPNGILTGSVTASRPVTAMKIFAKNLDKNIRYTTYTDKGKYRFVDLFPGAYEISVEQPGFAAEPQHIQVGDSAQLQADFSLKDAPIVPTYVGGATIHGDVQVTPYDELYPAGTGRTVLERTCMVCHGVNFIARIPQGKEGWDAAIDFMTKVPAFAGVGGPAPMIDPAWISANDRTVLLDYLATNFGADKPIRAVQQETQPPLDEAALGKSMFVEYFFADTPEAKHRWNQETHFDSNGDVWVTERGSKPGITMLDPRTGVYKDYFDPNPKGSPHGLTVDADGTVWWGGKDVHLGHLDPVSGKIDQYVVAQKGWHGHTPVFDSKGDIWFSMLPGNKIGHWSRATDTITLIDSPEPGARPYGFIIDRSDKIWYVEYHRGAVVRYDPVTEKFTRFMIPSQPSAMRRLGIDMEGNIWYGVYGSASKLGKIGRLDPKTGKIVEFTIPIKFANPYDTWGDKDDNIWISTDNYLVKFEPKTQHSTIYPTPTRSDMPKLSTTRDGAIWYAIRMSALTKGGPAGVGVLYPDKDKIKGFGAYYGAFDTANHLDAAHPPKPVVVTGRAIGHINGGSNIGTPAGSAPAGAVAD